MQIYIVAILVALCLVAILFFALRSTVKRIDENTRKYFVDKLQDYDYLIDERKAILDDLEQKIEKNKNILSDLNNSNIKEEKVSKDNKFYSDKKNIKYMDQNLFKKYKDIKEKFNFDYEKIITKFLKENVVQTDNNYMRALKLRKKFSNEKIYEIIKLRPQKQKEYLVNFLSEDEYNFLKKFIEVERFKLNSLITNLDTYIEKNDPIIYVITGQKNDNYDHISPNIKTIHDQNINEGIKINYKGILYDYSL